MMLMVLGLRMGGVRLSSVVEARGSVRMLDGDEPPVAVGGVAVWVQSRFILLTL